MTVYSLCLVFILTLCGWHLIVLFLGFAIPGIDYILHNLYFNSSLKGISPPQWQHFICSRIFFCQLLTLYQENWISPPQWQDFICSGIWFCQLLNLQQENRISPPQWQGFICSRIYFFHHIILHQENRISPPQWQGFIWNSINHSFSDS